MYNNQLKKVFKNDGVEIECLMSNDKNSIRVQSIIEGEEVYFTINENIEQTFQQLSNTHAGTLHDLLYDVYLAKCG
jgi:hypothetical protein